MNTTVTAPTDPAAVLRAAADLAERRARGADAQLRWETANALVVDDRGELIANTTYRGDAEHIAAADPAFMLSIAAWWRWAADLRHADWCGDSDPCDCNRGIFMRAALPSALAYLRQDNGHG